MRIAIRDMFFVSIRFPSYYKSNMNMLDPEVSSALFRSDRPIYTKIKDEPPTLYVKAVP